MYLGYFWFCLIGSFVTCQNKLNDAVILIFTKWLKFRQIMFVQIYINNHFLEARESQHFYQGQFKYITCYRDTKSMKVGIVLSMCHDTVSMLCIPVCTQKGQLRWDRRRIVQVAYTRRHTGSFAMLINDTITWSFSTLCPSM